MEFIEHPYTKINRQLEKQPHTQILLTLVEFVEFIYGLNKFGTLDDLNIYYTANQPTLRRRAETTRENFLVPMERDSVLDMIDLSKFMSGTLKDDLKHEEYLLPILLMEIWKVELLKQFTNIQCSQCSPDTKYTIIYKKSVLTITDID